MKKIKFNNNKAINTSYNLISLLYIFIPCIIIFCKYNLTPYLLVRFSPDDAFYYLEIAYNFAKSGIISFDGVNITTGFHPLQLFFVTFLEYLFNKNNTLIVLFVFNFFAIGISFILIVSSLKVNKNTLFFYSIATLPIFNLLIFTNSGMESSILAIILSFFYYLLFNINKFSFINISILGLTVGLVVLARLDMIIPMSIFGFSIFFLLIQRRLYSYIFLAIGMFLLVVLPYFFWMLNTQGSIFPISSIVKQSNPKATYDLIIMAMTGGQIAGYSFVIIPIVISLISLFTWAKDRKTKNKNINIIAIGSISNLLYMVYIFQFAHEPYRWYLNYCLLSSTIALMVLFDIFEIKILKISPSLKFLIPAFCLIINIASIDYWANLETVSYGLLKMTYHLNSIVPENSNLAIADSGVVGYFSTSHVHNIDGLANSYENWKVFLEKNYILDYSKKYKINYLLLKDSAINNLNVNDINGKLTIIDRYKVQRFSDMTLIKIN